MSAKASTDGSIRTLSPSRTFLSTLPSLDCGIKHSALRTGRMCGFRWRGGGLVWCLGGVVRKGGGGRLKSHKIQEEMREKVTSELKDYS